MKTLTLTAAIAQFAAILCGLFQYGRFLFTTHHASWDGQRALDAAMWAVQLVAAIMLGIFLLVLSLRQRAK